MRKTRLTAVAGAAFLAAVSLFSTVASAGVEKARLGALKKTDYVVVDVTGAGGSGGSGGSYTGAVDAATIEVALTNYLASGVLVSTNDLRFLRHVTDLGVYRYTVATNGPWAWSTDNDVLRTYLKDLTPVYVPGSTGASGHWSLGGTLPSGLSISSYDTAGPETPTVTLGFSAVLTTNVLVATATRPQFLAKSDGTLVTSDELSRVAKHVTNVQNSVVAVLPVLSGLSADLRTVRGEVDAAFPVLFEDATNNYKAARLANYRAKRLETWQWAVSNQLLLANAEAGSPTNGLKPSAYFTSDNAQLVATVKGQVANWALSGQPTPVTDLSSRATYDDVTNAVKSASVTNEGARAYAERAAMMAGLSAARAATSVSLQKDGGGTVTGTVVVSNTTVFSGITNVVVSEIGDGGLAITSESPSAEPSVLLESASGAYALIGAGFDGEDQAGILLQDGDGRGLRFVSGGGIYRSDGDETYAYALPDGDGTLARLSDIPTRVALANVTNASGTAVSAADVNALPASSRISDWPADIDSAGATYTASAKLVRDKALQKDSLITDWPADIASGEASYVASAKLVRDKTVLSGTSSYVAGVAAGGNALEFTLGDGSTVDYSPSFEMSYPSTMVFKDPASSKISFWSAGMITPSMLGVFVSKPDSTYANMDKEAIYYAGTPTMENDEKRKYYFWDGYHYTRVADADNLGIFMGPPLDYSDAEVGHVYMADAGYTFMQPTTNAADKTRFYLWDGTRYTTVADAADYTDVVRTARTVNGYPLSANVELDADDVGATTRAASDARYGSQFAEATADLQGGVRLGRGLYPVLQQNNMSVKYYTKYRACNLKIGSTSHPCYISEYDAQNYSTSGIGAIYQSVGTYPYEYMQPFQGARVVVSGTVPMDITVYFGTTAYELEIGSATLQSENACRVVEPSIFEAFSATRGYAYGQTCLKDGKLYRCVIPNYYSGKAWNANYWSEIKEEPTNGVTATDGELYVNGSSLTVNSRLEGLASHKQNIIQINTPAGMNAEDRTFDDFIQYTGTTTASFKQGHFYRMVTDSPRVWQEVETMTVDPVDSSSVVYKDGGLKTVGGTNVTASALDTSLVVYDSANTALKTAGGTMVSLGQQLGTEAVVWTNGLLQTVAGETIEFASQLTLTNYVRLVADSTGKLTAVTVGTRPATNTVSNWSSAKTYVQNDLAVKDGTLYVCVASPTAVVSPSEWAVQHASWEAVTVGPYSVAVGATNVASGVSSHAEGSRVVADGVHAHAEGVFTRADGTASHAEGTSTRASGRFTHAEGITAEAEGLATHAEGSTTYAEGVAAHAEGLATVASDLASHAEGYNTVAAGLASHAEGSFTYAGGTEGTETNVAAHASGWGAVAESRAAFVWQGLDDAHGAFAEPEDDEWYYDHGDGTFNVNPVGGVSGFWVGETNLADHIAAYARGVITVTALPTSDIKENAVYRLYAVVNTNGPFRALGDLVGRYTGASIYPGTSTTIYQIYASSTYAYFRNSSSGGYNYCYLVYERSGTSGSRDYDIIEYWNTPIPDTSVPVDSRTGQRYTASDLFVESPTGSLVLYRNTAGALKACYISTWEASPVTRYVPHYDYRYYAWSDGKWTRLDSDGSNWGGVTTNDSAFVWQGTGGPADAIPSSEQTYRGNGPGTFNINPVGGLEGVYVGQTNLATHFSRKVDYNVVTQTVNDVKAKFYDAPLQTEWTVKMVNGEMKLYATTNVNTSVLN